jgi:pSer/pThr/pTyr-binding forkhead associated (FHA) protein
MESRSRKQGRPIEGEETDIVGDKTVVLNNGGQSVIFAWLVDVSKESVTRIDRDVFTIGSSSAADLVLPLSDVKDIHCSIYFLDSRFELNDNNSRHGTRINGQPVKRQELADNDVISVAAANFQFKCFQGEHHG